MMKAQGLAGLMAVMLASTVSAHAETAGDASQGGGVPTVTIINEVPPDYVAPSFEDDVHSVVDEGVPADEFLVEVPADSFVAEPEIVDAAEPAPPLLPTLHIDINLSRQIMTVSEGRAVLYTWPISSGRRGYRTPTGTFQPTWMARRWFSRQYDNAPMPHSIFFYQGVAIHGSLAVNALGRPASHGCVRLAPGNAASLYRLVSRHGKERTQIVVHGTPNHDYGPAAVASRGERIPRGVLVRQGTPFPYLPPSFAAYGPVSAYAPPPRARRRVPARVYAPLPPRGVLSGGYGYGF